MTREREEQTRKIVPLRIRETNTQLVGWRICLILDHHCSRQTWRYSSPMTITTITKKHAREMNVNFWLSFVIFCLLPFENSAGLFQRTWIRFYRILYKERKRTDVENMGEKKYSLPKEKGRTHREMQKEGTFGWDISVTSLHVYEMGFWVGAMYCESWQAAIFIRGRNWGDLVLLYGTLSV